MKLRNGFTTGSCATAGAKAALYILNHPSSPQSETEIILPSGERLTIPLSQNKCIEKGVKGFAQVIKDAGDDPDITHGLAIEVTVELQNDPIHSADEQIVIEGGVGVGKVTKAGLQVPKGHWAINPVPQQMIRENLKPLLKDNDYCKVMISIPEGARVAERTFNPRLGIEGGLSIIGTSGIVRPMSQEAYRATIDTVLRQNKVLGSSKIILVPGMHGERFAQEQMGLKDTPAVHMSNEVGYTIKRAQEQGFEQITLVGHVGKLVKLAGGIFNTHSRIADAKTEIIIAQLAKMRAPYELMDEIQACNTTDEMSERLWGGPYEKVFQYLAEEAKRRCLLYEPDLKNFELLMYDMSLRILGDTRGKS